VRRRRRGADAPISLFSFQDVIMCVTGIVILVTLMMTLDLINRVPAKSAADSDPEVKAKALQQEVVGLQREINEENRRMSATQQSLSALSEINLAELPSEIEREKARLDGIRSETKKAASNLEGLQRSSSEFTNEKDRLAAEVTRLEHELREATTAPIGQVSFVSHERTSKTPVLVECSGAGVKVRVLSDPPMTQSFVEEESNHYLSAKFCEWLRHLSKTQHAMVVLIKPSAARYAPAVVEHLREEGFDVGFEPLEEEKSSIF